MHSWVFLTGLQMALALRTSAIFLIFEKLTGSRMLFGQIALKTLLIPILSGSRNLIIERVWAHIHIFVLTDHKTIDFKRNWYIVEHEYVNMCPSPPSPAIIQLATPLTNTNCLLLTKSKFLAVETAEWGIIRKFHILSA